MFDIYFIIIEFLEVWLNEHVHYYEAYGFNVLGGQIIRKEDLESSSSGDFFEGSALQYWVMVKWPNQGSGGNKKKKLKAILRIKTKLSKKDLEDAVSIVKDTEKRKILIDSVPNYKFLPCANDNEIISINGPDEQNSLQTHEDWLAAQSITTYPIEPISKHRQGEPIADRYKKKILSFE